MIYKFSHWDYQIHLIDPAINAVNFISVQDRNSDKPINRESSVWFTWLDADSGKLNTTHIGPPDVLLKTVFTS